MGVTAIVSAVAAVYSAYDAHQRGAEQIKMAKENQAKLEAAAASEKDQQAKSAALEAHNKMRREAVASQVARKGRAYTIMSDVGGKQTLGAG